jgi:hypothetical protein
MVLTGVNLMIHAVFRYIAREDLMIKVEIKLAFGPDVRLTLAGASTSA